MTRAALEKTDSLLEKDEVINGPVNISRTIWVLRITTVGVVMGLAVWSIVGLTMDDLWNMVAKTTADLWNLVTSLTIDDLSHGIEAMKAYMGLLGGIFYLDFLMTFAVPFIVIFNVIYQPLMHSDYLSAITFTSGLILLGLVHGLDHRGRLGKYSTWKYKPLTVMMTTFINIWLIVQAIITMNKNVWGTR
jgi:hypothetical protein